MRRLIIIMLAISIMFSGCSKKDSDKQEKANLDSILNELDYIVNARYTGVDELDTERVSTYYTESTSEELIDNFKSQFKNYILVESEYTDAEKSFKSYKDSIEKQNNALTEVKKEPKKEVVSTPKSEKQENGKMEEEEVLGLQVDMQSDMYNADGETVWNAKSEYEIAQMTDAEIQEYVKIKEKAVKSFTDNQDAYDKELQKKIAEEAQMVEDSKDDYNGPEVGSTEPIEIDMNDFNTDERIQVLDGQHVIMLEDVNLELGVLNFEVYGVDFSISTDEIQKPYDIIKGNEVYNFTRTYYALYDNDTLLVSYSSHDANTNKGAVIKIEVDLVDGKINISDITQLTSSEW